MSLTLPSYNDMWARIKQAIKMVAIRWRNATSGSLYTTAGNNTTAQIAVLQALCDDGVYSPDAGTAAFGQLNADAVAVFTGGRAVLDPLLLDMGKVIKSSAVTPSGILDDLFVYMAELGTPDTVLTRAMGYGTASASGGMVGNGSLVRHTSDRKAYGIQNSNDGRIALRCSRDRYTGSVQHEEIFNIIGDAPPISAFENPRHFGGNSIFVTGPNQSLLTNPSFDDDADPIAAVPTGWTTNSGGYANISYNTGTLYHGSQSLAINATEKMIQDLSEQTFDPNFPYIAAVVWNRNSATGTLTLRLGSKSTNVVLAAQSGWAWLSMSYYYDEFAASGLDLRVEWTKTTNSPLISTVILAPMNPSGVDATFFSILPSSDSNGGFRRDTDYWTIDDAHTNTGVIQFFLYLLYGKYLPWAAAGETISDPTFV